MPQAVGMHSSGVVLGCSALVMGASVLGYGVFNLDCILWDQAMRLTQSIPNTRSARTVGAGINLGVGCVETLVWA